MNDLKYNCSNHPLIQDKLTQLRDKTTKASLFRKLISDICILLAYEATSKLPVKETTVATPICETQKNRLDSNIALVPVLRAGLGMVTGFLDILPEARVIHIGLFRNEETLEPVEYYKKLPPICDCDIAMILDPMLATGGSAVATIQKIKEWGVKKVVFMCVLAAHQGIRNVNQAHPDVEIYCGGVDDELNEHGYIVPGLGDAGDRQYQGDQYIQ
ncbi:hypothetical protein ABK040_001149 [Willaertia magna]